MQTLGWRMKKALFAARKELMDWLRATGPACFNGPMTKLIRLIAVCALVVPTCSAAAERPNIVFIYADDLGYAGLSVTGATDIKTPHIDSLAANGARFTDSYVTGCVCSPSRAALLTGRYQQRFGFDANAEGRERHGEHPHALDLKQTTIAQRLKQQGYATGLVGKWHQGVGEGYLPNDRGFDEFYGLLPHGVGARGPNGEEVPIYRNRKQVEVPADHNVAWGEEAKAFIERHAGEPFFLYLAFTAVHAPHGAPQKYLDQFASAEPRKQRYLAMLALLDDAIGGVLAKLRERGLEEKTLIFFASDNGGPANSPTSNGPFSGGKWSLWEGGIRSPILIQWKGHIPGGQTIKQMTTQLDWLPTAMAAAGIETKTDWQLDGVNLLPVLEGKSRAPAHDALFWRFGIQYAVRQGDWKLLKPSIDDQPKLFNLANDPGEKHDLAAKDPAKVKELQKLWDEWNAKNEPPRWIDERWNGLEQKAKLEKRAEKAAKGKA
jgi:arylsulfatase A-like enzyme